MYRTRGDKNKLDLTNGKPLWSLQSNRRGELFTVMQSRKNRFPKRETEVLQELRGGRENIPACGIQGIFSRRDSIWIWILLFN